MAGLSVGRTRAFATGWRAAIAGRRCACYLSGMRPLRFASLLGLWALAFCPRAALAVPPREGDPATEEARGPDPPRPEGHARRGDSRSGHPRDDAPQEHRRGAAPGRDRREAPPHHGARAQARRAAPARQEAADVRRVRLPCSGSAEGRRGRQGARARKDLRPTLRPPRALFLRRGDPRARGRDAHLRGLWLRGQRSRGALRRGAPRPDRRRAQAHARERQRGPHGRARPGRAHVARGIARSPEHERPSRAPTRRRSRGTGAPLV